MAFVCTHTGWAGGGIIISARTEKPGCCLLSNSNKDVDSCDSGCFEVVSTVSGILWRSKSVWRPLASGLGT